MAQQLTLHHSTFHGYKILRLKETSCSKLKPLDQTVKNLRVNLLLFPLVIPLRISIASSIWPLLRQRKLSKEQKFFLVSLHSTVSFIQLYATIYCMIL